MKAIINVVLWKCISDGTVTISCSYQVKTHSLLYIWFRNTTKYNRAKSSTYINYGNDKTGSQNPFIPTGKNNRFGYTDLYAAIKA